jgi:hypothetical protein
VTAVAGAAAGLVLAGPTFLAISETSRSRPFAILANCSAACAIGAAAIAALAALLEIAALFGLHEISVSFTLLAAPAIGAAPWAAGELCAGPSPRQDLSFAAALIAAYLLALATEIAAVPLLVRSVSTACGATTAYLCVRGEAP